MPLLNDSIADKQARLKARLAKQAQLARQLPGVPSGGPVNEAPGINQFTPDTLNSARQNLGPNAPIKLPVAGATVTLSGSRPNPNAPADLPNAAEKNLRTGQFEPATREQQIRQAAKQKQNVLQGPHAGPQATMDTGEAVRPQQFEINESSPFQTEAPADDPNLRSGQQIRADGTVKQMTLDPVSGRAVETSQFDAEQKALRDAEIKRTMRDAGATTRDKLGRMLDATGRVVGQLPQNLISGDLAKSTGAVAGANVEAAQAGFEEGTAQRQAADIDAKIAGLDEATRVPAEPQGPPRPVEGDIPPATAAKAERNIFQRTLDSVINKGKGLKDSFGKGQATVEEIAKKPDGKVKGLMKGIGVAGGLELGTNLLQTIIEDQENAPEVIAEQTGMAVQHIAGRLQRGEFIELAQEAAVGVANMPAQLLSGGITAGAELIALNAQLVGNVADQFGVDAGIFGPDMFGNNANFGKSIAEISEPDYVGPNPEGLSGRLNAIANSFEQGSIDRADEVLPFITGNANPGDVQENPFAAIDAQRDESSPRLGQALIDQSFEGGGGGGGDSKALVPQPQMVNGRDISQLPNEQRDINQSRGLRAANDEITGRRERTFDANTGRQMSRDANLRTDNKFINPNEYGGRNRFSENPLANFVGELSRSRRQSAGERFEQDERKIDATERVAASRGAGLRDAAQIGADTKRQQQLFDGLNSEDERTRENTKRSAFQAVQGQMASGNFDPNSADAQFTSNVITEAIIGAANEQGIGKAAWNSLMPGLLGGGGRGLADWLNGQASVNSAFPFPDMAFGSNGDLFIRSTDPDAGMITIGSDGNEHLLNFLRNHPAVQQFEN